MGYKRLFAGLLSLVLLMTACAGRETESAVSSMPNEIDVEDRENAQNKDYDADTAEHGTVETENVAEQGFVGDDEMSEYAELVRKLWVRKGCPETETGTLAFVVYEDIEGDRYLWNNVWNYGGMDTATCVERGDLGYCYWNTYVRCVNTKAQSTMMQIGMVEMELDDLEREICTDFPEKDAVLYEVWKEILKVLYKGETLLEKKHVTFYLSDFDSHSHRTIGMTGLYNREDVYRAIFEVLKDENGQDVHHITGKWEENIYSERLENGDRERACWAIGAEIEIVTPGEEQFEQYGAEESKAQKLIQALTQYMGEQYHREKGEIFGVMKGQIYIMNHLEEEHYKLAQAWVCLEGSEPKRVDIISSARGEVKEIRELEEGFTAGLEDQAAIIVNCEITTESIN